MKLQEFVTESLLAITGGVRAASSKDPQIAPRMAKTPPEKGKLVDFYGDPAFLVEFDVAVSTSREAEISGEAKGGLISVISGGVDSSLNTKNELMNRLKFSVPIVYTKQ